MGDVPKQVSGDSDYWADLYDRRPWSIRQRRPRSSRRLWRLRVFRDVCGPWHWESFNDRRGPDWPMGAALLLALITGCGAVTPSDPPGVDSGARADVDQPSDSGLDSLAPHPLSEVSIETGPVDVGAAIDAAPPPCPGVMGTSAAQTCRDVNGLRCATGCQDTNPNDVGQTHPLFDGLTACIEPGRPFTGGIPVLCVIDCASCP